MDRYFESCRSPELVAIVSASVNTTILNRDLGNLTAIRNLRIADRTYDRVFVKPIFPPVPQSHSPPARNLAACGNLDRGSVKLRK